MNNSSCQRFWLFLGLVLVHSVANAARPPEEKKTLLDLYGDPLPSRADARMGTLRLRHENLISSVAFSPDARTIATVSKYAPDTAVRLWDVAGGKAIRQFNGHKEGVTALAFSPDGKTLVTGSLDGTTRLWDVATGKEREVIEKGLMITALAWSPDGKLLAGGSNHRNMFVWEKKSKKIILKLRGSNVINEVAFSHDGTLLAAVSELTSAMQINVWNVATGKEICCLGNDSEAFCFCPDQKTLASTNQQGNIRIWDLATGNKLRDTPRNEKAEAWGKSPWETVPSMNGKWMAWGLGGDVFLWDVKQKKVVDKFPSPAAGRLACTNEGRILLASDVGQHIDLWDVKTGKMIYAFRGHQDNVNGLAYSPDGNTLATVSADSSVRLWQAATGKELQVKAMGAAWFTCCGFSRDGKTLATGQRSEIMLWNPADLKEPRTLEGPDWVSCVAFSPNGKILVSGTGRLGRESRSPGHITFWDLASGKKLREFPAHEHWVSSLQYSSDGRTVVSAGGDGTICVWDAVTGKRERQIQPALGVISSMALSPDDQTLIVGTGAGRAHILGVGFGKERCRFGSLGGYAMVAASPDGRTVAVSATDKYNDGFSPIGRELGLEKPERTIFVVETATGKERFHLQGHRGGVCSLAFAANGKTLATASLDSTAMVWNVTHHPVAAPDKQLDGKQLESLWQDLANGNADRAFQAIQIMAASPQASVPFLRERLRPEETPAARQLERWLKDLDDERFKVREEATKELMKHIEVVVPTLRKALVAASSVEVRRRLSELIELGEEGRWAPKPLRGLRALEVLEYIGSGEVRPLLETLTGGVAHARLTREAKASLQRLSR